MFVTHISMNVLAVVIAKITPKERRHIHGLSTFGSQAEQLKPAQPSPALSQTSITPTVQTTQPTQPAYATPAAPPSVQTQAIPSAQSTQAPEQNSEINAVCCLSH